MRMWLPLSVPVLLTACAQPMGGCQTMDDPLARDACYRQAITTSTWQGAGIGAVAGGALGAAVGGLTGNRKNALPGAAAGAALGGLVGGLAGNAQGQAGAAAAYRDDNERLRQLVENAQRTNLESQQRIASLNAEFFASKGDRDRLSAMLTKANIEANTQRVIGQRIAADRDMYKNTNVYYVSELTRYVSELAREQEKSQQYMRDMESLKKNIERLIRPPTIGRPPAPNA